LKEVNSIAYIFSFLKITVIRNKTSQNGTLKSLHINISSKRRIKAFINHFLINVFNERVELLLITYELHSETIELNFKFKNNWFSIEIKKKI